MNLIMFFLLSLGSSKAVEVRFTDVAPKIDGIIEDIWQRTDSAYGFFQIEPYEMEQPTDRTVAYVLQDEDNLYFAFRCFAKEHKITAVLGQAEDNVGIAIDPFGSKTTAYYFMVNASGQLSVNDDGWVLDDGRSYDQTWDAVWYRASRVYNDRWEAEIKIPFKSIRYKKGLSEWGVNFIRYVHDKQEDDIWTEVSQMESNMVSKYGRLTGINPQAKGYYFELYPEGFVRYDKYMEEEVNIKPKASLNFKWDLTPQTTLTATAYPDFAQIESDPYTLNLSRYPTYLDERRPFFTEGYEIFRMSDMGEHRDFFTPLNIYYSRSIGKSLNGEPIPIFCGLKLTNRTEDLNIGMLAAYTDSLQSEPRKGYGVLRFKHRLFESSDIGMLFSGSMVDNDDYNCALGFDGVIRSGLNQVIIQGAASRRNEKNGWAINSGYFGYLGNFQTMISACAIHDSFDVGDIGFVPWVGTKSIEIHSGPYKRYNKGLMSELYYGPGIILTQEQGEKRNWSKLATFTVSTTFRNKWGFNIDTEIGTYYEADTSYFRRDIGFYLWSSRAKYNVQCGSNYTYSYNYYRDYLTYQCSSWILYYYSVVPRVAIQLNSNLWIEWNPLNEVIAVTPIFTPRLHLIMTRNVSLSIFNEFVMSMPEANFGETELLSNRMGFLFSWNFSPKSWLYIALNDYQEQNEIGKLRPKSRISAIKVKYLIYF